MASVLDKMLMLKTAAFLYLAVVHGTCCKDVQAVCVRCLCVAAYHCQVQVGCQVLIAQLDL